MAKRKRRRKATKGIIRRIRVKGRGIRCMRIVPGKRAKFVKCPR